MQKVYTYIRATVRTNDSIRRQHDWANEYAIKHNFVFDESLVFTDVCRTDASRNLTKGQLGKLMEELEQNPNSIVLIEDKDRLYGSINYYEAGNIFSMFQQYNATVHFFMLLGKEQRIFDSSTTIFDAVHFL